jgi:hypothetical protein
VTPNADYVREWEIEEGVRCVVCPACAFTFDAIHKDTGRDGYSCPCCGYGAHIDGSEAPHGIGLDGRCAECDGVQNDQYIIIAGDYIHSPVGPFASKDEAHAHYQRNQPSGRRYLSPPRIVRMLRPAHIDGSGSDHDAERMD